MRTPIAHHAGGKLWAVTCYFNPVGYRRRLHNYLRFRRALTVPLLTVELSYQGRFEVPEQEATSLVRLQGRDVLWQKERLLNVALEHLPDCCDKVAWIDADVLLQRPDWAEQTERLLEEYPLVQLFDQLVHLGPDGKVEEAAWAPPPGGHSSPEQVWAWLRSDAPRPEGAPLLFRSAPGSAGYGEDSRMASTAGPSRRRTSLAYRWATRTLPRDLFLRPEASSRARCNCGMGWAAGRSFLEQHGLYDAMILGMGDKMIAAAALGLFEDARQGQRLNRRQSEHYLKWAIPVHERVRGRLGYLPGTAWHLWHGDLADRRYAERYDGFEVFDFDPGRDLAIDPSGCWRWNSEKKDLHRHVEQYFQQRREDGRGPGA